MKKYFLSLAVLALVVGVSSCGSGSGFESDVRKQAKFECSMSKLMAKDQNDEKVKKEIEDLQKEMDEFEEKMEKKYDEKEPSEKEQAKAMEIMKEEKEKCK